ncbi:MAG: FecR domain-containing protein [Allorhizobium sp.]
MSIAVKVFSAVLFILATAGAGQCAEWIAAKVSQPVQYTTDNATWTTVEVGAKIPNKAVIVTGARGRLLLTRNKESITFQPNSLASLTTSGFFVRKTEIAAQYGSMLFDIETRNRPHTSVQTPFLAAVVKGTKFDVTVTRNKASVNVSRGLVEVTGFARGERAHVRPGQSVTVDPTSGQGMRVVGVGPKDKVISVPPTAASVPVLGPKTPASIASANAASIGTNGTTNGKAGNAGKSAAGTSDDDADNGAGNRNSNNGNAGNSNSGNGNAGGNGNASGNGNPGGNAGGNGNAANNGNGNPGGNGNGNGNAGGNGNGNAGGNGHANGNGNGNGNAGGNGNGNAGGNGNGNGKKAMLDLMFPLIGRNG